jgi:hypothetical protein
VGIAPSSANPENSSTLDERGRSKRYLHDGAVGTSHGWSANFTGSPPTSLCPSPAGGPSAKPYGYACRFGMMGSVESFCTAPSEAR